MLFIWQLGLQVWPLIYTQSNWLRSKQSDTRWPHYLITFGFKCYFSLLRACPLCAATLPHVSTYGSRSVGSISLRAAYVDTHRSGINPKIRAHGMYVSKPMISRAQGVASVRLKCNGPRNLSSHVQMHRAAFGIVAEIGVVIHDVKHKWAIPTPRLSRRSRMHAHARLRKH